MAETHELRLKINAAAARAGAREFVSAINSIKTSIRQLDRDSEGTFTKLKRNLQEAARGGRVKLNIVDRTSLRNLDSYARLAANAVKATASTSRSVANLSERMQALSGAYGTARGQADSLTASVARLNQQLARQASVAGSAASAASRVSSPTAAAAPAGGAASRGGAQQAIADQDRVRAAVEATRASVERLTTSLMKVGGFQSLNVLGRQFRDFERQMSNGTMTAAEFARAQNQMRAASSAAATALTTLSAKARDEARAEREAATGIRERERAMNSASAAMRTAEQETARLINRLRAVGDARGIETLNSAMIRLRSEMSGTVGTTQQVRTAMAGFQNVTSRLKVDLLGVEGAQAATARSARQLAQQENEAGAAARRLERDMRSAAGAANAADRAFRSATGGMRGMENAFSGSFQAASLFRTALGSITLGTFTKSVFAAGDALQQFSITMEVASGSAEAAADDLKYINDLSSLLGTNLSASRDAFSKFAVSAQIAGVSTDQTREIFESVSTAMAVLGRGTEDQKLAFLALEQMMSKGVISAEELRRQLGERLPGAVSMMARAVGVSTSELQDMLKAGELVSSEVLPKFAAELNKTFGSQLSRTFNRAGANLGRMQNEFTKLLEIVANNGFLDVLSDQFRDLTTILRSSDVREAAARLGEGMADAATMAGEAIKWLVQNIETVGNVVKNVIGGIIIAQFARMGQAVFLGVQQTIVAVNAFRSLSGAGDQVTASLTRQGTAAGAAATQTARLAATATTAAAAGGRLGAVFGVFGRVLGVLGGPIGIALSALMLVPMFLNNIGEEADTASAEYEAAMRRMGQSTFYLIDQAKELESLDPFAQFTANLPTLREAEEVIAGFRLGSDGLGDKLSAQFESLINTAPSARDKIEELKTSLETMRSTTDIAENAKQVAEFKNKIEELLAETSKIDGAFEGFTALQDILLDDFRAINLANSLMEQNTQLAGENAAAYAELAAKRAKLNEEMISAGFDLNDSLYGLSQTIMDMEMMATAFGQGGLSAEIYNLGTEITALSDNFDTSTETIETARQKLIEYRGLVQTLEGLHIVPQEVIDGMYAAIDGAEADIAALDDLKTQSEETAAAQEALGATIATTAGTMSGAAAEVYDYAHALDVLSAAQGRVREIRADAGQSRSRELEVARLRESDPRQAAILQDRYFGDTARTVADLREQLDGVNAELQAMNGNAQDGQVAYYQQQILDLQGQINTEMAAGAAAAGELFDLRESSKSTSSRKEELTDIQKLVEEMKDYNSEVQTEILANQLLAEGRVRTAEAADFMAQAMRLGIDVTNEQTAAYFQQIDAVNALKEKMEELANDPVNDWMNSVSSWREAGQQIETQVFDSLSDAISNFIQTGEFSFEDLGASILATAADIISDIAVKELVALLGGNVSGEGQGGFGLGQFFSDMFGNKSVGQPEGDPFAAGYPGGQLDPALLQNALVTGGQQAAELIRQAMAMGGQQAGSQVGMGGTRAGQEINMAVTSGGQTAGTSMQTSIQTGGAAAASQMGAAVSSGAMMGAPVLGQGVATGAQQGGGFFQQLFGSMFGGMGGGGGMGGLFSSILGALFMSGGGVVGGGGPSAPSVMAPAGMFKNAPKFAMGTPNVSGGVPAILHDNEAVVPLTGGRKIPIEGGVGGGGGNTVVQNFNITTPDADSFRKSQSQIAVDAATAGQRAMQRNR